MRQLALFDFDGTVYSSGLGVADSVVDATKEMREKGIESTMITGRSRGRLLEVGGEKLKKIVSSDLPLITENGARFINDGAKENLIYHELPALDLSRVVELVTAARLKYLAFFKKDLADEAIMLVDEAQYDKYLAKFGHFAEIIKMDVAAFFAKADEFKPCLLTMDVVDEDRSAFEQFCGENALNMQKNDGTYSILKSGINKGSAVLDLADYYGLALNNVIVAGNDYNDLPMLNLNCGKKYFVGSMLQDNQLPNGVTRVPNPHELGMDLLK